MARPAYEATDKDRNTVASMTARGADQAEIIALLGISKPTLRKYYRRELDTGASRANNVVAGSLFKKCKAGDTIACIFWLKTRAGWREPPQDINHGGSDGGPIRIEYSWAEPQTAA